MTDPRLMTRTQVARELGVHREVVAWLIADGHLEERVLPGRRYPRVTRDSVEAYLRAGSPPAVERVVVVPARRVIPKGGRRAAA